MNKTARRVTRGLLLFVFAVIVGMAVTAWGLLHLSVPMTDGPLELAGPGADIEITFDEMGIPQIWAETEHDGYFALGYQHAADRMFQMDLVRRLSQGRLSEMLGDIALETDIGQRRIGQERPQQDRGDLGQRDLLRLHVAPVGEDNPVAIRMPARQATAARWGTDRTVRIKIGEFYIYSELLGGNLVKAFGLWDINDLTILLVLLTIVISFIYKLPVPIYCLFP